MKIFERLLKKDDTDLNNSDRVLTQEELDLMNVNPYLTKKQQGLIDLDAPMTEEERARLKANWYQRRSYHRRKAKKEEEKVKTDTITKFANEYAKAHAKEKTNINRIVR